LRLLLVHEVAGLPLGVVVAGEGLVGLRVALDVPGLPAAVLGLHETDLHAHLALRGDEQHRAAGDEGVRERGLVGTAGDLGIDRLGLRHDLASSLAG
jgi:hypothetical protein